MARGPFIVIAAGVAGAVLSTGFATARPARAATVPTYTCDRTYVRPKGSAAGFLRCVVANGPASGPIHGTFVIRSRGEDPEFECTAQDPADFPSGEAALPDDVFGFHCEAG